MSLILLQNRLFDHNKDTTDNASPSDAPTPPVKHQNTAVKYAVKSELDKFWEKLSNDRQQAPPPPENRAASKLLVKSEVEKTAKQYIQSTPLRAPCGPLFGNIDKRDDNFKLPLPVFTDFEVTTISEVESREVRQTPLETSVLKTPAK